MNERELARGRVPELTRWQLSVRIGLCWLLIEILNLGTWHVWNMTLLGESFSRWNVVHNLVHWMAVTLMGVIVFGSRGLRLPTMSVPRLALTVVGCTATLASLSTLVYQFGGEIPLDPRIDPVMRFAIQFQISLAHIATTIGTAYAFQVYEANRWRMKTEARLESDLASAELRLLRVQLQPHFLMNALNGISGVLKSDPTEAGRQLNAIGNLLRLSLASSRSHWTTVADEIAFIEAYLDLQRFRFGPRLRASVQSDPAAAHDAMPSFLLQPIVENSIRHAVEKTDDDIEVAVCVTRGRDSLEIEIWNSGPRLSSDSGRAGIGLTNTELRLELLYDGQADFSVSEPSCGGVRTWMRIPFHSVK